MDAEVLFRIHLNVLSADPTSIVLCRYSLAIMKARFNTCREHSVHTLFSKGSHFLLEASPDIYILEEGIWNFVQFKY